jgi:hypothetical protein
MVTISPRTSLRPRDYIQHPFYNLLSYRPSPPLSCLQTNDIRPGQHAWELPVVADSIPEVAEDHFHLRLSSPNLIFQLHASLVGGVLTTDTAYPDMFALEWYEWDPE